MRFNPKEEWKSSKLLSGGEASYHKKSTIMSIQLPDGNTTITDAGNVSVLGPHFAKFFCVNLPVDLFALYEVRQRDAMQ